MHDLSLIRNISCARPLTQPNSQPSACSYTVGQTGGRRVPQTHEKRAFETLKGRPPCYSARRGKDSYVILCSLCVYLHEHHHSYTDNSSFESSVVTKGITDNSKPYCSLFPWLLGSIACIQNEFSDLNIKQKALNQLNSVVII